MIEFFSNDYNRQNSELICICCKKIHVCYMMVIMIIHNIMCAKNVCLFEIHRILLFQSFFSNVF